MSKIKEDAGQQILGLRKGAVRDLKSAYEIIEKLLMVFPAPTAIIDQDYRFLEINDKLERILGAERRELAGRRLVDVIEFPVRNRLGDLFVGSLETPIRINVHLKDSGVDAEAVIHGLKGEDDARFLVVFNISNEKDRTLVRLIEERTGDLMKNAEKLRSIFEYSPDAIVVTDLDGTIIDCNQAMLDMNHFPSKEEVIGREITDLVSPKDKKRLREDLKHTLNEGSVRNVEYTFLKGDGYEFPVELSANAVLDAEGKPALFVIEAKDIAERKLMEKKLKQYSERLEKLVEEKTRQLREAERLAAIGELAAMIGHDLRNPLMGIAGAIYYLKEKLDPTAEKKTKEMLSIIKKCIEYSNKIVNDLLDYSGDMRLDLENTSPRKIIVDALSQISIPDNIKVVNSVDAEPIIRVDVNKMKRVIVNIVRNAIDAMPNGGVLEIKSWGTNGEWKISIGDTGMGIPEEIKDKLGKPLITTKAKGMGLGFAICRRIVKAHEGSITVKSSVGKGTTVTVSIPLDLRPRT